MQRPSYTATGYILSIAAFVWWGLFPLYIKLVDQASSLEILAHRVVWCLPVCVFLIALWRGWGELRRSLAQPKVLVTLLISAAIVTLNWLIYIYSVESDQVLASSLGYFISPLVTLAMGMVFLKERPGRLQLMAMGLAALGTLNALLHQGGGLWISLSLAFTFSTYGLIRKTVKIEAVAGLLVETALITPLALAWLLYMGFHGHLVFGQGGWSISVLLGCAGIITAVPLIWFTAGARRVPLHVVGIMQYIGPSIQFVLAITLFNEVVSPARLITFALVWAGVAMYLLASSPWMRKKKQDPEPEATPV
ncbi:MAG: EamA family transporter RarD [Deltaproteobacteria bacterium]|nr:EamA family transporter RarD [Deltaproteobacteria bacterium]